MIDKEYKKKLQDYMRKNGITNEEDIDWFKVPTRTDYRCQRLKEIKKENKNDNT